MLVSNGSIIDLPELAADLQTLYAFFPATLSAIRGLEQQCVQQTAAHTLAQVMLLQKCVCGGHFIVVCV